MITHRQKNLLCRSESRKGKPGPGGDAISNPPGPVYQSTLILMLRDLAASVLGNRSFRTPFLKVASARSASTSQGNRTDREKEP